MMWRLVVALLFVCFGGLFWIEQQARRIDELRETISDLKAENQQLRDVADAHRRMQDADTSRGNSSDDLDWLCARSKHSAGCIGRAK